MGIGQARTREPLEDTFGQVFVRLNIHVSPQEFLDALSEEERADASAEDALTEAERAYLIEDNDFSEAELSEESLARARITGEVASLRSLREAERDTFTTLTVSKLLNMQAPNVRRARLDGRLYSIGKNRQGAHMFPCWQFLENRMLPGLRDVLAALPEGYHPLNVASFMTTENDALDGRSPVDWLATGGDVARVVRLADERAWV